MANQNKVCVIFEGYSHDDPEDSSCMRANCTSTLVRTRLGKNIIVDTRTAWDGPAMIEALRAQHSLAPKDIDMVVCTHGHSDHIGCNYLFTEAELHVVGTSVSHGDKYRLWDGRSPLQLFADDDDDETTVEGTPGHTMSCVSVLVRNTNLGAVVGICGDLFERREDIEEATIWLDAGSEDASSQRRERLRMAELCDYIVPGHGAGFAVTAEIRDKLRKDVEDAIK